MHLYTSFAYQNLHPETCGLTGNTPVAGGVQQQARWQAERAQSETIPGEHARQSSDGEAIREYHLVHRALPEIRGPCGGERSALLRVLRLRHHHRQRAETVAHRGSMLDLLNQWRI